MTTLPPDGGGAAPKPGEGINPAMRRDVDAAFSDEQHGSEPMETVSVKSEGPAVWPIVWAVVTIVLVLITIWLLVF